MEFIYSSIVSAFMAAGYSLSVYLSKTEEENWSFVKAGKTACLSAIVAFVGNYYGISEDILMSSPLYAFIGIVIERLLKAINKKIIPKLKIKLGELV